MNNFEQYLREMGLSHATHTIYQRVVLSLLSWCDQHNLEIENVGYSDLLKYIQKRQSQGISQSTLQNELIGFKHFFNWQLKYEKRQNNPAQHIQLQGIKRRSLYKILSVQEMESLYEIREGKSEFVYQRNKALLGLMIWQGAKTGELKKLEKSALDLRKGKVNLPGSNRSNARELKLASSQVFDLMEYVQEIKDSCLELLFQTQTGQVINNNQFYKLLRQLQRKHKNLESFKQLRASVITHWLKKYSLREVQYMAGHRYVSSTEAYKVNDLEGLQEAVKAFHPNQTLQGHE